MGETKFMGYMWLFLFWNFPLEKLPSSTFSSSIQNVPSTQFPMSNFLIINQGTWAKFPLFPHSLPSLMNHGVWRGILEIPTLGHKWKFHVSLFVYHVRFYVLCPCQQCASSLIPFAYEPIVDIIGNDQEILQWPTHIPYVEGKVGTFVSNN